jgi:hypothetical protein
VVKLEAVAESMGRPVDHGWSYCAHWKATEALLQEQAREEAEQRIEEPAEDNSADSEDHSREAVDMDILEEEGAFHTPEDTQAGEAACTWGTTLEDRIQVDRHLRTEERNIPAAEEDKTVEAVVLVRQPQALRRGRCPRTQPAVVVLAKGHGPGRSRRYS